jgi:hypothetical protein
MLPAPIAGSGGSEGLSRTTSRLVRTRAHSAKEHGSMNELALASGCYQAECWITTGTSVDGNGRAKR